MKSIIDLFLHAEGFENWRGAIVIMQPVAGTPGNIADERAHSIERASIVAHHLIDFLGQKITDRAFDQVGLFKNAVGRGMIRDFLLDLAPLIEKEAQIAHKIAGALTSPTVRIITPIPSGISSSRKIFLRRSRSFGSSILREIPLRSLNGMRTR